jgi:hypothetical protein
LYFIIVLDKPQMAAVALPKAQLKEIFKDVLAWNKFEGLSDHLFFIYQQVV